MIPNKTTLELMLAQPDKTLLQVMYQNVKEQIRSYKLPYAVVGSLDLGYKLVDVGDSTDACLERFITRNSTMLLMKDNIRKLSVIEDDKDQLFSVLITGPTGTGKELLARALHGDRAGKFQAINCAGLPSELIESELFGHCKGAFTGAIEDKPGLMKIASKDNGTLFLDEIGDLALPVQAKLLRAIQSKEIRRVGDTKEISISCRLVCATHRNLEEMIEHETFREDLFARISTFEIHTLPLVERQEDIEPIILAMDGGKEFWNALNDKASSSERSPIQHLDLKRNVRSLQQAVKRYTVLRKLP